MQNFTVSLFKIFKSQANDQVLQPSLLGREVTLGVLLSNWVDLSYLGRSKCLDRRRTQIRLSRWSIIMNVGLHRSINYINIIHNPNHINCQ